MVNIAPLDYERYLALVGPFPLAEAGARAIPPGRQVEELTQISERMDLWQGYSAEGEVKRIEAAQQARQREQRETPQPPVHPDPEPQVAWTVIMEAANIANSEGGMLNVPPANIAASFYESRVEAPAPKIVEIA